MEGWWSKGIQYSRVGSRNILWKGGGVKEFNKNRERGN